MPNAAAAMHTLRSKIRKQFQTLLGCSVLKINKYPASCQAMLAVNLSRKYKTHSSIKLQAWM